MSRDLGWSGRLGIPSRVVQGILPTDPPYISGLYAKMRPPSGGLLAQEDSSLDIT